MRETASLIGSVFVHVDYSVPFEAVREELTKIARASPLWDGRVVNLQVSDAKERTVQLRALVSARNAPKTWESHAISAAFDPDLPSPVVTGRLRRGSLSNNGLKPRPAYQLATKFMIPHRPMANAASATTQSKPVVPIFESSFVLPSRLRIRSSVVRASVIGWCCIVNSSILNASSAGGMFKRLRQATSL